MIWYALLWWYVYDGLNVWMRCDCMIYVTYYCHEYYAIIMFDEWWMMNGEIWHVFTDFIICQKCYIIWRRVIICQYVMLYDDNLSYVNYVILNDDKLSNVMMHVTN